MGFGFRVVDVETEGDASSWLIRTANDIRAGRSNAWLQGQLEVM